MGKSKAVAALAFCACLFALGVVGLGAFTRLMDAGLGCPDWPYCYGHLLPSSPMNVQVGSHYVAYKAWAEMVHRYFVCGLSLLIFSLVACIFAIAPARRTSNFVLAVILIGFLLYQILLGQWTVTLKLLPIIVTQHLLGGFSILALLWLLYLNNRFSPVDKGSVMRSKIKKTAKIFFPFAVLGIILLVGQIFLGAWTSTNYASLSCPDFPVCMNNHNMQWQLKSAFDLISPIGVNYEGGVLAEPVRQTIQMTHRFGALIVALYLFALMMIGFQFLKRSPVIKYSYVVLGLLSVQLCLGISNVIFKLPVETAIAHNLMAALLLLSLITFAFELHKESR